MVIVVGDVIVDVVVRPLGPFNRGSDTASRIAVTPGGSASNQAVALAAAGVEPHLVGVVGDDELGRAAARALAASGVEVHLRVEPGQRTGVVVALVDAAGQRSMLTDRGANLHLDERDLGPGLLGAGRHLHLSGYELLDEATRPAARAALALAAASGMTRSVDPCSAGPLAAVGPANFLAWTEGLDWCCANLDEGRALTGASRPEDVLAGLRQHYREVALTLGPKAPCSPGRARRSSTVPPTGPPSSTRPGPATPSRGPSSPRACGARARDRLCGPPWPPPPGWWGRPAPGAW